MQRGAGAVEADIGGDAAVAASLVEALGVGGLVDEAAFGQHLEEFGTRRAIASSIS